MINHNDLPDWLDRHHVDIIRTSAATLDGPSVGKYLQRDKFLKSLPHGHTISDMALVMDIAGSPQMTHWQPQRAAFLGDILLQPDLSTLISDGTNPALGHCLGNFTELDGTPLQLCPRSLLQRKIAEVGAYGYGVKATFELEFFLFNDSFEQLRRKKYQQMQPVGSPNNQNIYLLRNAYHSAPFMTEVIRRMEWQGIAWEGWNDEAGTGQIELNLVPTDPLKAADNAIRTKQILYEVAVDQQMAVTFMARPTQSYASGMHIHHSLHYLQDAAPDSPNALASSAVYKAGDSAFFDANGVDYRSSLMQQWLGGLMATLPAAVSFLCPTINSYRRLTDFSAVPTAVSWGEENKSTALRLVSNSAAASRIEHRLGAADLNPYIAMAVILAGGLTGVRNQLVPPAELNKLAWGLPARFARLPASITTAAEALANDSLLTVELGTDFVEHWCRTRKNEWLAFHTSDADPASQQISEWEYRRYFELV
ncbi:MAG: glutamine synthetase [Candidatus Pseudothioglobus sp.]